MLTYWETPISVLAFLTEMIRMSNPCKETQQELKNRMSKAEDDIQTLRLNHEEAQRKNDATLSQLISVTTKNTETLQSLLKETQDIVKLWRDLQGVYNVGKILQDMVKWVAIIGGTIAITFTSYEHIKTSLGL